MTSIDATQALAILEEHAIVPKGERARAELFAAFRVIRLLILGDANEAH